MIRRLFLLTPFIASCTTLVPAPDVDLAGRDPQAAWARTLQTHVDSGGAIDFEALARESEDLDTFVAWVAQPWNPPSEAEAEAAELSYWINAYNGLAMYNVLHSGTQPKAKVRFFYLRELEQNGRRISLYDFENDVIRKRGDPRVHFALNCMVRSCPRLPREPFHAATLDAELERAAREFLNDPRHVEVLPASRTVRLSSILKWYKADFLDVSPSLLEYVNRYRSEAIPADFSVDFLPYDWTLNQSQ